MHVSAVWVYYSLGGMHFSRVTYRWNYIMVSVLGLFEHLPFMCHTITTGCSCQRLGFITVWMECTSLTFYVPHDDDKLLLTVCRDYYSLDGVYLSGVAYVRANFFGLSCKTHLGAAQVLHIEVRYPSLKADSTPRYYRRYADYGWMFMVYFVTTGRKLFWGRTV